jgi:exodeoxyribonuclease-3
MRIDHILLSNELSSNCIDCVIDKEPRKNERPSDHAPVMVDFIA